MVTGLAGSAHAAPTSADVDDKVATWDLAAARLGTAGSLWEPAKTAGLVLKGRIAVLADNLAIKDGAAVAGDTFAGAEYAAGKKSLSVVEKWANTGWAAEPAFSTSMAKVRNVRIPLGLPGTKIHVTAEVFANCFEQPADADPKPIPPRFRCARSDVRTTGGVLVMTARPASQMTAPGDTSIVLTSTGLRFRQLVAIASSLAQVAGAPGNGAGSAQMIAMCRQMVDGAMTPEQATAFATSSGYSARVGSIDGQPLAVTADFRPDRFTLVVNGGTVSSCTYG